MARVEKFEDLRIWQEARAISQWCFEIVSTTDLKNDYELRKQADRSIGSVMDNIAEGFERNGNREFIQFLSFAKGSAGEFRSQLYRMFDRKYIDEKILEEKLTVIIKLSEGIGSFMSYLNKSDIKGSKFRDSGSPNPKL